MRGLEAKACVHVFAAVVLAAVVSGCSSLRPAGDYPRTASFALDDPGQTSLGKMLAPMAADHPGLSGFYLSAGGIESFQMRMCLIDAAERTIDAQYYLFHIDDTGKLLIDAFLRAADRGVRVRLLIDDYETAGEDLDLAVLNAHPNVEVRLFNPFTTRDRSLGSRLVEVVVDSNRLNRRMHNKSFLVDNSVAVVGGRNLADEYFGAKAEYDFHDLDVLAVGPVVRESSRKFDAYWNSESAYPLAALGIAAPTSQEIDQARRDLRQHVERMKDSPYGRRDEADVTCRLEGQDKNGKPLLSWAAAEEITDRPEKVSEPARVAATPSDNVLSPRHKDSAPTVAHLRDLTARTNQELIMISPFFIPGEVGMEFLRGLRAKGVRVRVLTNSLASTDTPAAHIGYRRYREALLDMGVELYELKPVPEDIRDGHELRYRPVKYGLHTKAYVFDRQTLVLGSLNADPRSRDVDTETAIVIHGQQLASAEAERFDRAIQPGRCYRVMLEEKNSILGKTRKLVWITQQDGKEVRYEQEPDADPWLMFKLNLLSILPIESML